MLNLATIAALCTPQGNGALALIRLSGPDTFAIAAECIECPGKSIKDAQPNRAYYARITQANGTLIDTVMAFAFRGPRSFTGEDTIEITCHNNAFIVNSIVQRLIECGARHAERGEFTRQAFENGKLDLVQAEAINELISAQSSYAAQQSLARLEGSLSSWMRDLESRLISALAWCEASFEFLDDDGDFAPVVAQKLQHALATITQVLAAAPAQKRIQEGLKIALVGSVNAGKSSLFNALLGKERAIVTDIAGTTRDTIENTLIINNTFVTLIDTAGLRQTDDIIEQQGIVRSHEAARDADIVLLVIDQSREATTAEIEAYTTLYEQYAAKILPVYNKSELPAQTSLNFANGLFVSARDKSGIPVLKDEITKRIADILACATAPFSVNQRHMHVLENIAQSLPKIIDDLQAPMVHYELVSWHLRDVLSNVTGLTGKSVSEEALDRVFREFCVGK